VGPGSVGPGSVGPGSARLALTAAMGRPVILAGQRLLAVPEALTGLFPDGGLRRGSTVSLTAGASPGITSLALALTVPVTRSGSWVATVGLTSLGLVAAAQLGAALDRMAIVPSAGDQWPVVAAALLDSVDILLLAPGGRVRPADARRLTARVRERGAVLVVLPSAGRHNDGWPEATDLHLRVDAARWEGLKDGAGHLQSRVLDVVATGRRAAARPRRGRVWLPGQDGRISMVRLAHDCELGSDSRELGSDSRELGSDSRELGTGPEAMSAVAAGAVTADLLPIRAG
jgi:hypothetical protein